MARVSATVELRITEPAHGWGEPGDMWPWGADEWWIVLPNCSRDGRGCSWRTDDTAYDGGGKWTVTGTAPLLTVTPSIDVLHYETRALCTLGPPAFETVRDGSCWHGWITNGELRSA